MPPRRRAQQRVKGSRDTLPPRLQRRLKAKQDREAAAIAATTEDGGAGGGGAGAGSTADSTIRDRERKTRFSSERQKKLKYDMAQLADEFLLLADSIGNPEGIRRDWLCLTSRALQDIMCLCYTIASKNPEESNIDELNEISTLLSKKSSWLGVCLSKCVGVEAFWELMKSSVERLCQELDGRRVSVYREVYRLLKMQLGSQIEPDSVRNVMLSLVTNIILYCRVYKGAEQKQQIVMESLDYIKKHNPEFVLVVSSTKMVSSLFQQCEIAPGVTQLRTLDGEHLADITTANAKTYQEQIVKLSIANIEGLENDHVLIANAAIISMLKIVSYVRDYIDTKVIIKTLKNALSDVAEHYSPEADAFMRQCISNEQFWTHLEASFFTLVVPEQKAIVRRDFHSLKQKLQEDVETPVSKIMLNFIYAALKEKVFTEPGKKDTFILVATATIKRFFPDFTTPAAADEDKEDTASYHGSEGGDDQTPEDLVGADEYVPSVEQSTGVGDAVDLDQALQRPETGSRKLSDVGTKQASPSRFWSYSLDMQSWASRGSADGLLCRVASSGLDHGAGGGSL